MSISLPAGISNIWISGYLPLFPSPLVVLLRIRDHHWQCHRQRLVASEIPPDELESLDHPQGLSVVETGDLKYCRFFGVQTVFGETAAAASADNSLFCRSRVDGGGGKELAHWQLLSKVWRRENRSIVVTYKLP